MRTTLSSQSAQPLKSPNFTAKELLSVQAFLSQGGPDWAEKDTIFQDLMAEVMWSEQYVKKQDSDDILLIRMKKSLQGTINKNDLNRAFEQ